MTAGGSSRWGGKAIRWVAAGNESRGKNGRGAGKTEGRRRRRGGIWTSQRGGWDRKDWTGENRDDGCDFTSGRIKIEAERCLARPLRPFESIDHRCKKGKLKSFIRLEHRESRSRGNTIPFKSLHHHKNTTEGRARTRHDTFTPSHRHESVGWCQEVTRQRQPVIFSLFQQLSRPRHQERGSSLIRLRAEDTSDECVVAFTEDIIIWKWCSRVKRWLLQRVMHYGLLAALTKSWSETGGWILE